MDIVRIFIIIQRKKDIVALNILWKHPADCVLFCVQVHSCVDREGPI